MPIFYLIRHAETEWNKSRKLQGHSDVPINENGRSQAVRLGRVLQRLQPEVFFASDLSRAIETAQIAIQKFDKPLMESSALRELNLGQAEGLSREQIAEKFGSELWEKWASPLPEHFGVKFPEGESRTEALQRFETFVYDMSQKHENRKLAFFTHGLILRTFSALHNPNKGLELLIPNCSCLEFRWVDRKAMLLRQIDTPELDF